MNVMMMAQLGPFLSLALPSSFTPPPLFPRGAVAAATEALAREGGSWWWWSPPPLLPLFSSRWRQKSFPQTVMKICDEGNKVFFFLGTYCSASV